jgi:FkbM family methyltransferase
MLDIDGMWLQHAALGQNSSLIATRYSRCPMTALPIANTRAEAEPCLRAWKQGNWKRETEGPNTKFQCSRIGSRLSEDMNALRILSGSDGFTASADKLWSSDESPRYFFEAGAYDGFTESNTLMFERCLNWTGVLLEANPRHYEDLLKSGRHRAHRIHVAPSCAEAGAITISNGLTDATTKFDPKTPPRRIFKVPCVPLQRVISQLGLTHFDFLSLDVEGAELDVMNTLDFNKTSADLMLVESRNRDYSTHSSKSEGVRKLVRAAGYDVQNGGVNDIVTKPFLTTNVHRNELKNI